MDNMEDMENMEVMEGINTLGGRHSPSIATKQCFESKPGLIQAALEKGITCQPRTYLLTHEQV